MPDTNHPKATSDTKDPRATRPQPPAVKPQVDALSKIVERINNSDSILIALSDNPSVDELSVAIGLTLLLDRISKHATAIFSGQIPDAIKFLKPEETLEKNTDSLRDFIIALDKSKADHIRYMVEGDYVRIYITPYRTTISEKDLEFSQGNYNVDLVIAISVDNTEDLDDALSEYGRIMHDATTVGITNGTPGHFADVEWNEPGASSVCEMAITIAERLGINEFDQDVATAFLTGIVAATERFSNSRTTPDALTVASKLMSFGADQQLISANVMPVVSNASMETQNKTTEEPEADTTKQPEEKPLEIAADHIPTPADDPSTQPRTIPLVRRSTSDEATQSSEIPTAQSSTPDAVTPIPSDATATSPESTTTSTPTTSTPDPSKKALDEFINLAAQVAPDLPTPDLISLPQIPYDQPVEANSSIETNANSTSPLEDQIKPIVGQPDTRPVLQPLSPEPHSPIQPSSPTPPPLESSSPQPETSPLQSTPLSPESAPLPTTPSETSSSQSVPLPPLPMPPSLPSAPTPSSLDPTPTPPPLNPISTPSPFAPTSSPISTTSQLPSTNPTMSQPPLSTPVSDQPPLSNPMLDQSPTPQSSSPISPMSQPSSPTPPISQPPSPTPVITDNASFQIPNYPQ